MQYINIMGITKSDNFTEKQNEIANQLKALAHPARIAIIEHLLKVDSCICNDIVNEVNLAQPTISQHLKELKQADLIQGNIEGKSICYCLNEKTLANISNYINNIATKIKIKNKCC